MPRTGRTLLLGALVISCFAGETFAQDDPVNLWQPVDQTVADLDLRATSLRYVEQGIGAFGQNGSLYRRTDDAGWLANGQPLSQTYQLRQPGFTAYIDRPDYLVIDQQGEVRLNVAPAVDHRFIDPIPANTVFDLVYHPANAAPRPTPDPVYNPWFIIPTSNTRINGRIDGQVTGDPMSTPLLEPVTAHRLPEHLIKRREARRAEAVAPTEADTDAPPSDSAEQ